MLRLVCAMFIAFPLLADDMSDAYKQLGDPAREVAAAEFIVAHAQRAPAQTLLTASMVMIRLQRFEEAGFLSTVGQLRGRLDHDDDVALTFFKEHMAPEVEAAMMRRPKVLAAVIRRIAAWTPAVNDTAARATLKADKKSTLDRWRRMATLLDRPEYLSAYITIDDCLKSAMPGQKRPCLAEAQAAALKMLQIEATLGIEGLYYKRAAK